MPQIRMIGLVLFITAVLLALAAAATKTTHIRMQTLPSAPERDAGLNAPNLPIAPNPGSPAGLPIEPAAGQLDVLPANPALEGQVQFTSVPVMWPLLAAGGLGMLLWFWQPSELGRKPPSSRRRRT